MATPKLRFFSNDDRQNLYPLVFNAYNAGTLNGSFEAAFVAPFAGELDDNPVLLSVGVNTTHDSSTPQITATLEKNSDGGTNMLAQNPIITNAAGTGQQDTAASGTGITPSTPSATTANKRFSKGDLLFVTVTESGSGGTDPSDVAVAVVVHQLSRKDTDQTVDVS